MDILFSKAKICDLELSALDENVGWFDVPKYEVTPTCELFPIELTLKIHYKFRSALLSLLFLVIFYSF